MEKEIIKIINKLNYQLNMVNADITFIKYENNYLFIKLVSSCLKCEERNGMIIDKVYEVIKERLPEIEGVINLDI